MPFTAAQLATGANYALQTYARTEPMDQINTEHETLKYLIANKEESNFTNGAFREPLHIDNGSNYQNYFGADQVTFNERDPTRHTSFPYFSAHTGFYFDEDRLLQAGIVLTDDRESVASGAEKEILANLLKQSYRADKAGWQEKMALELLRDGSQSTKACPGLASIVDPTPATGTVGGIDASSFTWWRNNANLSIVAANVVDQMEKTWRDCRKYGGEMPDFIPCGAAFLDNYRLQAGATINRQIVVNEKGGTGLDASVSGLYFKGIPLVWDPDFEALDALLGTTTQTKTAYFLNKRRIKLRNPKGHWMVDRKPERLPDRYVHYFGKTAKYAMTTDRRSALAVLSIA
jgi:hypothetical protein